MSDSHRGTFLSAEVQAKMTKEHPDRQTKEPSGPRTELKVNESLVSTLEGVPNIRATKFNSAKQLTFA